MKIKAIVFSLLSLSLFVLLNTKMGDVPPVGRFFDPFAGFWQNAEPADKVLDSERFALAGTHKQLQIVLDTNLVPHIFARNDHDLFFAQGYVTARFRLWQMEFQTHAAAGRISEIIGEKALAYDRYQRRMGMVLAAERSLQATMANPQTREAVTAYADGVNAYIASLSPRDYPIEYKLLGYAPEKWTPLKTALLLKYMAHDLAGSSEDWQMTNVRARWGKAVTDSLFPNYPHIEDPIRPIGTPLDFKPLSTPPSPPDYLAQTNAHQSLSFAPTPGSGSNNWAVSGAKSATGLPLLANDPHLALNLPSLWFQVQLVSPTVNVYGASLPGAPSVIIGFNQNIAWGVTNVASDVMDWYDVQFKDATQTHYWHAGQWKPTSRRIETIQIRGGKTQTDTIVFTHHGPVVYAVKQVPFKSSVPAGRALRWIAHEASNELLTFYKLNRAHHYDNYVQAIAGYVSPAQNFVYADVQNNIALWSNGKYPHKWKGQGKYILDGTHPAYDWQGWIPQPHNPHVLNPKRGFVSSANQFPADTSYPYYLDWQFEPAERGIRINQRLSVMQHITADSMRQLQNDNKNLYAERILPTLLQLVQTDKLKPAQKEMYQALSSWNFMNNPELVVPTFFERWWSLLMQNIWRDEFSGDSLRYPSRDQTIYLITHQPKARWFDNIRTPRRETLKDMVSATFGLTYQTLARDLGVWGSGWQWGHAKGTQINHIAKIPGMGSAPLFIGGGRDIVNATREHKGPSWRMVVALGKPVKGYGVYPGGQSGNPGSYYYDNMIETWRKGELRELIYMQTPHQKHSACAATWVIDSGHK